MLGFLRETKEAAIKAGKDARTGLIRSGLDEYLAVIFPGVTDWVHDKTVCKELGNKRPDYRSESLKLIIEFDGIHHFQKPTQIRKDNEAIKLYSSYGYKVVRIPCFIQLTASVIKKLFKVDVDPSLVFPDGIGSFGGFEFTPAYFCPAGIERCKNILKEFPDQYEANLKALKEMNDDYISGYSLLK